MTGSEPTGPASITGLLARLRERDDGAFDELFPLVYGQLRELAHVQRRRVQDQETLNTTALVHEAYIKLAQHEQPDWKDRSHFLAVAARAMRQVLIDYARARQAAKRGAGSTALSFEDVQQSLRARPGFTDERIDVLVALDASLRRLERENERHSRIVECRFFGAMTIDDTAEALGISRATVKRGWAVARAWLYRDLRASLQPEG